MCWWYLDLSLNMNAMEGSGADLGCLMTLCVECSHSLVLHCPWEGMARGILFQGWMYSLPVIDEAEDRLYVESEVEDMLLGEGEDRLHVGGDVEDRLLGKVEGRLQVVGVRW